MSLERRSRAVAVAGRSREFRTAAYGALGVTGIAVYATSGLVPFGLAGGFLLGMALGILFSNADRSYMEGFSDGLAIASSLDADGAPATRQRGGDRAVLRGLPGDAGEVEPRAAASGADSDQRLARGAVEDGAHLGGPGLRGAFDLPREPGPRPAPLDATGAPVVIAQGPRVSGFPDIPAAEPARPPGGIGQDGPPPRRKARRSIRARLEA